MVYKILGVKRKNFESRGLLEKGYTLYTYLIESDRDFQLDDILPKIRKGLDKYENGYRLWCSFIYQGPNCFAAKLRLDQTLFQKYKKLRVFCYDLSLTKPTLDKFIKPIEN